MVELKMEYDHTFLYYFPLGDICMLHTLIQDMLWSPS